MHDSTAMVINRTYKGELRIDCERMERFSMHELLMENPDRYRAQLWQCVVTNWQGMKIRELIVITFRDNILDSEWMRERVNEGEMDTPIMSADDDEMFCMYKMHDPDLTEWDDEF